MQVRPILLSLALLLVASATHVSAQATTTAYLRSEVTTGMTKQCIYEAMGSVHTRTMQSVQLCPISIRVNTVPPAGRAPQAPAAPTSRTITAYKQGEVTSGMTKQCIYEGLGSTYVRTMNAVSICPISIQVTR